MNNTLVAFRWEFRQGNVRERAYAEAELEEVGSPGDKNYLLTVYLVRDDMAYPTDGFPLLDPERRTGQRVYVGVVRSREEEKVRQLAYMAPVEGHRMAYTMIFNLLRENVPAVEKFGDDWLTDLMKSTPKKAVKRRPKNKAVAS